MSTEETFDETANFETTTSDLPIVEENVEKSDDESINSESKTDENNAEGKEPTKSDDNTESAKNDEPKKENGVQKRINKITREREEARRETERLRKENEELKKGNQKEESKEPKESDFETYDEYLEAIEGFEKKESKEPEKKSEDQNKEQSGLTDSQITAMAVIKESISSAEKPQDFDEVALAQDVEITGEMLEAIAECDDPAKVMYHLGKNKDLAYSISKGSPAQQMREIAKLDLNVKPPKPKEVSKAPDVIEPVLGVDVHEKPISEMSYSEYEAHMNKKVGYF